MVFMSVPEEQRPLGKPTSGGEIIETDVKETGWEFVVCIKPSKDRENGRAFVNTVMNPRAPISAENFFDSMRN